MDQKTVEDVADDVRSEVGPWMISELDSQGLCDAVADAFADYSELSKRERRELVEGVYEEIFGTEMVEDEQINY